MTGNRSHVDRRTFLLGSTAAGLLTAQAQESEPAKTQANVRLYQLNRNWLFGGKARAGVSAPDFNDSAWQKVTLPHTNVRLPWHSFDERAFQYVSAYRRHFRALPEWQGKRVFLDFDGAMAAAKVTVNGHAFVEYKGGYTPFHFELTPHLKYGGDNVIAVELDSTERPDIPPFGGNIDYLTFGGIYRDVWLRVVPHTSIENVYAKPVRPLSGDRALAVRCYLLGPLDRPATLTVELRDGAKVLKTASATVSGPAEYHEISLESLPEIELWSLSHPKLYDVAVRLKNADGSGDEYRTRAGFREARYTPSGFMLNGEQVKLRGLNRHQTFPYLGGAMPARVQRRDAWILRRELHCNIVRTSHYPQSPAFLDACDELGLLVLEEIPGWQHIGDQAWQDLAVRNVGAMIRRDWNHPSIVLWGVRINESQDNHDFYTRTNALAHSLDDARQTGGIRYLYDSELLEDVFTMNDFGFPLRPPNHPLYMNTEFNGHMFSTKRIDNVERVAEHVLRHARVHDQLASDDRYSGGTGWCAFDYNTHKNFGSGDHICYHGVSDIFRIPKPAAYFYASQCEPEEQVVLEAGFFWSQGDRSQAGGVRKVPILSNCDRVKVYWCGQLKLELEPDRATFPHLKYPPFSMDLGDLPLDPWGDVKIEGYLHGKLAKTLMLSGSGKDAGFKLVADDNELVGDGRDAARVVIAITDEYGNFRPFASAAIALSLSGPAELIGENPFVPVGGAGAVWIKAKESAGVVNLTATHPFLGKRSLAIQVKAAPPESV
ncbi:MAG TPA: glycoside hydrolase family 2 TIM barrel-domain containing protein [Bryobacteraceae bacterium]|nr:glycoside hydrolase family 2 TIM barrel-domain containing protein [Bryobacteraceae bacterium]